MDKNLWKEIIANVIPLKKRGMKFGHEIKPVSRKKNHNNDIDVSFISVEDIKFLKYRYIIESDLFLGDTSRVDKGFVKNVKRGKFCVDAKLDLHGKTLETAFKTFISFVNSNYENEKRNLLIVTGKGNPEKNTGIIRKNFPLWLNDENIKDKILYVNFANISDGGDGAFYIFLRKKKFE